MGTATASSMTNGFQSPQSSLAVNQANNQISGFSMSTGSQSQQMSSSFQASQSSSSFKSASSFNASSSFQASSSSTVESGGMRSQTFEAFPGMGGIENLNLASEKAGK